MSEISKNLFLEAAVDKQAVALENLKAKFAKVAKSTPYYKQNAQHYLNWHYKHALEQTRSYRQYLEDAKDALKQAEQQYLKDTGVYKDLVSDHERNLDRERISSVKQRIRDLEKQLKTERKREADSGRLELDRIGKQAEARLRNQIIAAAGVPALAAGSYLAYDQYRENKPWYKK